MGKNLKGREIGKGLSQRQDGRYSARFVTKSGKRTEKYFLTLAEAKSWLADAQYEDRHYSELVPFELVADEIMKNDSPLVSLSEMTVDDWYKLWSENIVSHLAWNTRRNYQERYIRNIQPVIGKMRIQDVRPIHCRKILNDMDSDYKGSTVRQTYIAMGTMFRAAVLNDVIQKHPMDGVRYTSTVKAPSEIKYLTIDEQKRFLDEKQDANLLKLNALYDLVGKAYPQKKLTYTNN